MIPKIIHICWLSGDEFPKEIRVCLNTWKSILPDYSIWLWGKRPKDSLGLDITEKTFDINSIKWTKQAFENKKYAFAADYIRLYAVYNFGGIYLDSDVMMFKSFNDLLELPYFLGEDFIHGFEPAIFGAEKECKWIKDVMCIYNTLEFHSEESFMNNMALPKVFHRQLTQKYRFHYATKINDFSKLNSVITIFPKEWFNSRNYIKSIKSINAYCSHQFAGSWLKNTKSNKFLKNIFPDWIVNLAYAFAYNVIYRRSVFKDRIIYINK